MESSSTFSLLNLPRELRDAIYFHLDTPNRDHYITYDSAWSNAERRVIGERTLSPSLKGILGLHQACKQTRSEISPMLERFVQDLTFHCRILTRDDAALFTAVIPHLQRLHPTTCNLRITWNISGEHVSVIEMVPRHLPHLKVVELEVIDKLDTTDFFRDAGVMARNCVNSSDFYDRDQKRIGDLILKDITPLVNARITTGVYQSVYLLRFENEDSTNSIAANS
ncbi:hypothetical protein EJ08DRAFT_658691 [Tothia fuscella]|uniref:F-box domain-containing protein n=1 Tax=Tothia fuscella TaxID=1048955 RepID=A0A9P4NWW6_9PEZI|nr:hypothetical protein EJ08DRAFT_658691 [Tothia fuscella]